MKYNNFIDLLTNYSNVPSEVIENVLGTLVIFIFYFLSRVIFNKYFKNQINEKYQEQVSKEIAPHFLGLLGLGFLLKVWLTGDASVASFFKIPVLLMDKIIQSIYIYLFYLGAKMAAEVFVEVKYASEDSKIYPARRTANIVLGIICLISLLKIWIDTTGDLSTYLGLLSAGIAIALQDVITSLAGWVYLMLVKPFQIGERIQIGDHKGDVIDIKLFQFSLLETGHWIEADQPSGRILNFPNSFVLKNVIANYNSGFQYIFTEIPIMVTFESDWQKALLLLEEILKNVAGKENLEAGKQIKRASRSMRLFFTHLDARVITSVADSGVVLTLRFLCKVRDRRFLEAKIWEKVLKTFAKHNDIDFAYPTTRYYFNKTEGKMSESISNVD